MLVRHDDDVAVILRPLMGAEQGSDRGSVVHDVRVHGSSRLVRNAPNQQAEWAEVMLRGMIIHAVSPSGPKRTTWMLALRICRHLSMATSSPTLRLSRAWKPQRSVGWKASAAAGCSANPLRRVVYG